MIKKWLVPLLGAVLLLLSPLTALADGVPGDANGDGVTDMGDVVKVERIILGWDQVTPGADPTGDGVVDMGDVIAIELIIMAQP